MKGILPDGVDDGVVAGVSLGEDTTPDGKQRADGKCLEDTGVVDHQVGRPSAEPQRDGHQGDLEHQTNPQSQGG